MATLVLEAVGAAVGQIVGPIGAAIGQAAGALGGAALQSMGAPQTNYRVGPRLTTIAGISSMEGAPVPRVYGRARLGGQMIWATRFIEQANVTFTSGSGGKSLAPKRPATVGVAYAYYANFAIGLCEGPIAFVRRVWADGQELDLTSVTMRVYTGDETQQPDPLIAATEEPGAAPAYRGLAYVVFERMALAAFGNRVPQMTFEVVRPVSGLGAMIRGVDIIPGATEFGYHPTLRMTFPGPGVSVKENRNQSWAATDWTASLDALLALCPNLESVALVVVWFGDDLRLGQCTIAPRVDLHDKMLWWMFNTGDWSVAGLPRAAARVVSKADGVAAYGGTPSDDSVIAAVRDLKARGLSVVFYPFIMMDIPADNATPDPWTGASAQPAYPWRGRLVCDPAPGRAGTVDGTQAAGAQVAAFFGAQAPGPAEWSYRRFILHYADLCAQAGGVDAFLVGSEMPAMTRVRAAPGVYPAAAALAALAGDVRAIVGPATKISYAADWTEYGAHVLDGGAQVRFPLDVVWSAAAVDFIGLDAYWPVSDWRDGDHLDRAEADTIYDLDYLTQRMAAGEAYDWFYVDAAARRAQTRAPIADGAYGEHWMFRQKDLVGWWSNAHHERVGGVRSALATGWAPFSKPIWLIETGCAAVDRGTNAPNVFPDAKSSESGAPPFSRGYRDDLMQARFIEAVVRRFDPVHPQFEATSNPVSPLYGGPMVEPSRVHFWAWDARPFPAFPQLSTLWADAANWRTGHWLNGRLEGAPLDFLVQELAALEEPLAKRPDVEGFVDGYVLDRAVSARAALEQLGGLFAFDPVFSSGAARFLRRSRQPAALLGPDDLAPFRDGALVRRVRAQETDLPHEIAITFSDSENDYETATVLSRRLDGASQRRAESAVALITRRGLAQAQADGLLEDLWVARDSISFQLAPFAQALEAGDIVGLVGEPRAYLITRIEDAETRRVTARAFDPRVFDRTPPESAPRPKARLRTAGPPFVVLLDLAIARGEPTVLQYIAACADPWPGALAVMREIGGGFDQLAVLTAPATIGETLDDLAPGPVARFDRATTLTVKLYSGALASVGEDLALENRALLAVQGPDGRWEVLSVAYAELIAARAYRVHGLLRGLGGAEALAARAAPAGARVVLLDNAVAPLASGLSALGVEQTLRVGPVGAEVSDLSFVSIGAVATDEALRPYAPTQPRARHVVAGIEIAFIRRGRVDADAWGPQDIPLGEDGERYEIAIERPLGAPRLLTTTTQAALYATAEIAADFDAPPSALTLSIRQISATVGPGFALNATVPIV